MRALVIIACLLFVTGCGPKVVSYRIAGSQLQEKRHEPCYTPGFCVSAMANNGKGGFGFSPSCPGHRYDLVVVVPVIETLDDGSERKSERVVSRDIGICTAN